MAKDREPLVNFNIATMSGIYPGSRTMIYQRLRLRQGDEASDGASNGANGRWAQLQWYTDPASAILLQANEKQPTPKPLLAIPEPEQPNFVQRLHEGLSGINLKADACFACRNWQPLPVHTDDRLPAGRCRWNDDEGTIPSAIATQSALSLACQHFQPLDEPQSNPVTTTSPSTVHPRVLKSAELDPDRLPFWPRLWHRMRHSLRQGQRPVQNWTQQVIERSGVGAGTEPCFICQGRLANLGALAVASPEGDKQTLSVWRCRSCYTTYFNDWTDRWERLDNLETEESYYRIAPAETYAILSIIHATVGGDHPGRRHERRQQREQILAILSGNQPLSHQVRQGR